MDYSLFDADDSVGNNDDSSDRGAFSRFDCPCFICEPFELDGEGAYFRCNSKHREKTGRLGILDFPPCDLDSSDYRKCQHYDSK